MADPVSRLGVSSAVKRVRAWKGDGPGLRVDAGMEDTCVRSFAAPDRHD